MERKGFYLTVPSNASHGTYPNNTQFTFKICMATPIDLSGYTVAPSEIQNPNSWNNIKDGSFTLQKTANTNHRQTARLLEGHYVTMEQLIEAFQKQNVNLRANTYVLIHWDQSEGRP